MTTLWLTRHGNREDFVDPSWVDSAERPFDPGLSLDGVEQAKCVGRRLVGEGIERIFSSPYLRTVQTAHHIAEALEVPIHLEPGIGEMLFADWFDAHPEPIAFEQLARRFPRLSAEHEPVERPEYPETMQEAFERSRATAEKLSARCDGPILLVGHGASITGIVRGLVPSTETVDCALCSLFKLLFEQEAGWELALCGEVSHLDEALAADRFQP